MSKIKWAAVQTAKGLNTAFKDHILPWKTVFDPVKDSVLRIPWPEKEKETACLMTTAFGKAMVKMVHK